MNPKFSFAQFYTLHCLDELHKHLADEKEHSYIFFFLDINRVLHSYSKGTSDRFR